MGSNRTFLNPTLGSKPAAKPQDMVTSTYPPAGQGTLIKSAPTLGAALQYTQQTLHGVTNEFETNYSITPGTLTPINGNGDRVGLIFMNLGNAGAQIGLTTDLALQRGIQLAANGGSISMNIVDDFTLPSRQWWINAGGITTVYVLEIVRVIYPPTP